MENLLDTKFKTIVLKIIKELKKDMKKIKYKKMMHETSTQ